MKERKGKDKEREKDREREKRRMEDGRKIRMDVNLAEETKRGRASAR